MWTGIVGNYYVIVYNTKLISKEDAPKDWSDLTDMNRKSKPEFLSTRRYSWLAGMEDIFAAKRGQENS